MIPLLYTDYTQADIGKVDTIVATLGSWLEALRCLVCGVEDFLLVIDGGREH